MYKDGILYINNQKITIIDDGEYKYYQTDDGVVLFVYDKSEKTYKDVDSLEIHPENDFLIQNMDILQSSSDSMEELETEAGETEATGAGDEFLDLFINESDIELTTVEAVEYVLATHVGLDNPAFPDQVADFVGKIKSNETNPVQRTYDTNTIVSMARMRSTQASPFKWLVPAVNYHIKHDIRSLQSRLRERKSYTGKSSVRKTALNTIWNNTYYDDNHNYVVKDPHNVVRTSLDTKLFYPNNFRQVAVTCKNPTIQHNLFGEFVDLKITKVKKLFKDIVPETKYEADKVTVCGALINGNPKHRPAFIDLDKYEYDFQQTNVYVSFPQTEISYEDILNRLVPSSVALYDSLETHGIIEKTLNLHELQKIYKHVGIDLEREAFLKFQDYRNNFDVQIRNSTNSKPYTTLVHQLSDPVKWYIDFTWYYYLKEQLKGGVGVGVGVGSKGVATVVDSLLPSLPRLNEIANMQSSFTIAQNIDGEIGIYVDPKTGNPREKSEKGIYVTYDSFVEHQLAKRKIALNQISANNLRLRESLNNDYNTAYAYYRAFRTLPNLRIDLVDSKKVSVLSAQSLVIEKTIKDAFKEKNDGLILNLLKNSQIITVDTNTRQYVTVEDRYPLMCSHYVEYIQAGRNLTDAIIQKYSTETNADGEQKCKYCGCILDVHVDNIIEFVNQQPQFNSSVMDDVETSELSGFNKNDEIENFIYYAVAELRSSSSSSSNSNIDDIASFIKYTKNLIETLTPSLTFPEFPNNMNPDNYLTILPRPPKSKTASFAGSNIHRNMLLVFVKSRVLNNYLKRLGVVIGAIFGHQQVTYNVVYILKLLDRIHNAMTKKRLNTFPLTFNESASIDTVADNLLRNTPLDEVTFDSDVVRVMTMTANEFWNVYANISAKKSERLVLPNIDTDEKYIRGILEILKDYGNRAAIKLPSLIREDNPETDLVIVNESYIADRIRSRKLIPIGSWMDYVSNNTGYHTYAETVDETRTNQLYQLSIASKCLNSDEQLGGLSEGMFKAGKRMFPLFPIDLSGFYLNIGNTLVNKPLQEYGQIGLELYGNIGTILEASEDEEFSRCSTKITNMTLKKCIIPELVTSHKNLERQKYRNSSNNQYPSNYLSSGLIREDLELNPVSSLKIASATPTPIIRGTTISESTIENLNTIKDFKSSVTTHVNEIFSNLREHIHEQYASLRKLTEQMKNSTFLRTTQIFTDGITEIINKGISSIEDEPMMYDTQHIQNFTNGFSYLSSIKSFLKMYHADFNNFLLQGSRDINKLKTLHSESIYKSKMQMNLLDILIKLREEKQIPADSFNTIRENYTDLTSNIAMMTDREIFEFYTENFNANIRELLVNEISINCLAFSQEKYPIFDKNHIQFQVAMGSNAISNHYKIIMSSFLMHMSDIVIQLWNPSNKIYNNEIKIGEFYLAHKKNQKREVKADVDLQQDGLLNAVNPTASSSSASADPTQLADATENVIDETYEEREDVDEDNKDDIEMQDIDEQYNADMNAEELYLENQDFDNLDEFEQEEEIYE